jgi:hypothetical protein
MFATGVYLSGAGFQSIIATNGSAFSFSAGVWHSRP